ncbi:MAG: cytochrome-c peroxidase, partial [Candidatus Hydrogenedentes bacterium]|nr:cytochrome-c peroxidase [Candidatus Hydrogenedentota bacterium]
MKKYVVAIIVLGVMGALAFPIVNLLVGAPVGTSLTDRRVEDPLFAKVLPVLEKKCVNCHTTEYKLPFYANFPIAKGIIEADIKLGLFYMNMVKELFPGENQPPKEVALAKIEHTTLMNEMPPLRYIALHWDSILSKEEQSIILNWVRETRAKHYATSDIPEHLKREVVHPLPQKVEVDDRKVKLGEKLYHDKRLSKDNSISCASCHDLAMGGTDRKKFSVGVGGAVGPINAPTVYNALFNFVQFWDGRAGSLEEQADGPVNNPIEMASNWEEVKSKLIQDEELTKEFNEVYPEGYGKDSITDAIAEFERTLITPNSRFDQFLLGKSDALNPEEKEGYALFKKYRCATCHVGKAMGGQSFEKMGLKADYFKDRGGEIKEADLGRYNVTKNEEDKHKFKVPLLRNIALTAPYLHDSSTDDLQKVVNIMLKYQVGIQVPKSDEE